MKIKKCTFQYVLDQKSSLQEIYITKLKCRRNDCCCFVQAWAEALCCPTRASFWLRGTHGGKVDMHWKERLHFPVGLSVLWEDIPIILNAAMFLFQEGVVGPRQRYLLAECLC